MKVINAISSETEAAQIFEKYRNHFLHYRRPLINKMFAKGAKVSFSDNFLLTDEECPLEYKFWLISQKYTIRDVQIINARDRFCDIWVYTEKDKTIKMQRINNLKLVRRLDVDESYLDLQNSTVVMQHQPNNQVDVIGNIETAEQLSDANASYATRVNAVCKQEKRKNTKQMSWFFISFACFVLFAIGMSVHSQTALMAPSAIGFLISICSCASSMISYRESLTPTEVKNYYMPLNIRYNNMLKEAQLVDVQAKVESNVCDIAIYTTAGGNVVKIQTIDDLPIEYKTDIQKMVLDLNREKVYIPWTGVIV